MGSGGALVAEDSTYLVSWLGGCLRAFVVKCYGKVADVCKGKVR